MINGPYIFKEVLIQFLNKSVTFSFHRNFFELLRFDFVFDEDLNVYLMEANMSPNLASYKHPQLNLMFEQVLYGLFSLVGLTKITTYGPER